MNVMREPKREPSALDVDAVAAVLGVSAWSVRELIRTGKLPCLRVGRLIRVSRTAVDRFIEGESISSEAAHDR